MDNSQIAMGENSSEFLPIAILRNRYAVLIKIEFLEMSLKTAIEYTHYTLDFGFSEIYYGEF
jgi:hypothetical protein